MLIPQKRKESFPCNAVLKALIYFLVLLSYFTYPTILLYLLTILLYLFTFLFLGVGSLHTFC